MGKVLKDWTLADVLMYCENCEGCPKDCLFRGVCGHSFVVLNLLEDWDREPPAEG